MDNETTNPDGQFADQQHYHKTAEPSVNKHANGILIKGIITGFLILVMLIPTFFINSLINERQARQQEVVKEVSSKWANAQTLSAPFITIPYTEQSTDTDGKILNFKRHLKPKKNEIPILNNSKSHKNCFYLNIYRLKNFGFNANFNIGVFWQPVCLNCSTRGIISLKITAVNFIYMNKIIHIR